MSHPDTEKPDDHDADATQPRPAGESSFAPASPAAASPFAEYYRPPRLGIIHMLAWMAATAIVLKIDLTIFALNQATISRLGIDIPQASQLALVWAYAVRTIISIAQGAGLVGAAVLLRAWHRGIGGRLQPGHWIILIEVLRFIAGKGYQLICALRYKFDLLQAPITVLVQFLPYCFSLCVLALYLYVARRKLCERRWRRLFVVVAVLPLLKFAMYFGDVYLFPPYWLSHIVPRAIVLGTTLGTVVTLDLRARCRRDWIHWLGVALLATDVIVAVGLWAWVVFGRGLL